MSHAWAERAARRFEAPRWATPGALAQDLHPDTQQTPALQLIDNRLTTWAATPSARLIVSMPPQEGKSVRAAQWLPVWLLHRNPSLRIVMASFAANLAQRNAREVRGLIRSFPELGLTLSDERSAASDWELTRPRGKTRGGMVSVGVGSGLAGRPADVMIVDDPHKDRAEVLSDRARERVWEWWQSTATARLAPGAPALVIQTRWHTDDLAGRLIEEGGWDVLNIPAQAVEGPDLDPLGRQAGEYMTSARGRSRADWELRKAEAGNEWEPLYQGSPVPRTGAILRTDLIRRYDRPLWQIGQGGQHFVTAPGVQVIQSWDLAFKATASSDRVAGTVWAKVGADYFLLDLVAGRLGFTDTCHAIRALSAKWPQATAKLIEDAANGPAVMDHLRGEMSGLIPVPPKGGKVARAHAVSPLIEAGNVYVPSWTDWLPDYLTELQRFNFGAHDDQVDSTTQALSWLAARPDPARRRTQTLW